MLIFRPGVAFEGVVVPVGFAGEAVAAAGFAGEGFGDAVAAAAGLFFVGVLAAFFGDPFLAAVSL